MMRTDAEWTGFLLSAIAGATGALDNGEPDRAMFTLRHALDTFAREGGATAELEETLTELAGSALEGYRLLGLAATSVALSLERPLQPGERIIDGERRYSADWL